jgi:hypothetical protein
MGQIDFRAMTVNERLSEIGRRDEYYDAEERRDEALMRQLLEMVEVDKPSIELTIALMRSGKPVEWS